VGLSQNYRIPEYAYSVDSGNIDHNSLNKPRKNNYHYEIVLKFNKFNCQWCERVIIGKSFEAFDKNCMFYILKNNEDKK